MIKSQKYLKSENYMNNLFFKVSARTRRETCKRKKKGITKGTCSHVPFNLSAINVSSVHVGQGLTVDT